MTNNKARVRNYLMRANMCLLEEKRETRFVKHTVCFDAGDLLPEETDQQNCHDDNCWRHPQDHALRLIRSEGFPFAVFEQSARRQLTRNVMLLLCCTCLVIKIPVHGSVLSSSYTGSTMSISYASEMLDTSVTPPILVKPITYFKSKVFGNMDTCSSESRSPFNINASPQHVMTPGPLQNRHDNIAQRLHQTID